ncbi:MAG: hypothetical protein QXU18_14850 [Thermoplasmatales archaeon]
MEPLSLKKGILRGKTFKKFRYWREGKIIQTAKKRTPDRAKTDPPPPLNSFKDMHGKGKKPPASSRTGGQDEYTCSNWFLETGRLLLERFTVRVLRAWIPRKYLVPA